MLVSNINKAEHIKVNCSYAKCNNVAIFLLGKKSVSIHNDLDFKEVQAKFGVGNLMQRSDLLKLPLKTLTVEPYHAYRAIDFY